MKKRAFYKNVTDLQGVPEKTLFCVQRPITQVWKQLLRQVGAVLKYSGYQLSFEPKKSRIMQKHLCFQTWVIGIWTQKSVFSGTPCMLSSSPHLSLTPGWHHSVPVMGLCRPVAIFPVARVQDVLGWYWRSVKILFADRRIQNTQR